MFTETLLLVVQLLAPAGGPPGMSADEARRVDSRQTLRARQALFQEPTLGRLNLGVSVRHGVATLWGDVPGLEYARWAEASVRGVPGVLEVRSELLVLPLDDPLREFLGRVPPLPLLDRVAHRPMGMLASQPFEESVVALLPPIRIPALRQPAAPASLLAAVEKLRLGDARYRGLLPQIEGGVVRLRGTATRHEDVMELAQAIARLPGVERVVLQDVKALAR